MSQLQITMPFAHIRQHWVDIRFLKTVIRKDIHDFKKVLVSKVKPFIHDCRYFKKRKHLKTDYFVV